MYKVRNKVYADAGNILIGKNKRGYCFIGELNEFSEKSINLEDMIIKNGFVIYSEDMIVELYNPNMSYEQLKSKYVKNLFSNDDQIAIILNKDKSPEDLELFNKMQEWRD